MLNINKPKIRVQEHKLQLSAEVALMLHHTLLAGCSYPLAQSLLLPVKVFSTAMHCIAMLVLMLGHCFANQKEILQQLLKKIE